MRILVTGGAGYIGTAIAHCVEREGWFAVRYDKAPPWPSPEPHGPVIRGDVLDTELLTDTLKRFAIDGVVHCAGLIAVGESVQEPLRYWHQNLGGALSLLRAMDSARVHRLVFSSTAAVYGEPERVPIVESHPLAPTNPYGRTKLAQETLFSDLSASGPFRYVALRYFNAAGAIPGVPGERHQPETHLIPLAIAAALDATPLHIMGTDYPTPDGTAERDYIHVEDLAMAHVAALTYLAGGGASVALNLANSRAYSVRQVVDTVSRVVERPVPVIEVPRRAGDPAVLVGDSEHAQSVLGWRPLHGALDSMVASALDWRRGLAQRH